jgi:hypothetical protein
MGCELRVVLVASCSIVQRSIVQGLVAGYELWVMDYEL